MLAATPSSGTEPCVLLVGGSPAPSSAGTIERAAEGCAAVVAIDRGLDALAHAGLGCDLFCGDVDSASEAAAARVRSAEDASRRGAAAPFEVVRYNPHKDDTDLGLALTEVARRWPGSALRATCLAGGSPDHALAVMGRLATWDGKVCFVEDGFSGCILKDGMSYSIEGAHGYRFSFVPLSPVATVSEAGMRWELDRAEVPLLSDLGISNVIERDQASITCHEGCIACWLFS